MNRKFVSIIVGLVILTVSYFLSTIIMNEDDESYNKNTSIVHSVRTIKTFNTSNTISIKVNGTMSAKYKVDLFAEVQGTVINSKKDFKVGQKYKKNEVLLNINSQEFLATAKQSRSQLQNMIASVLPDVKLDFPENYINWESYFKNFNVNNNTKQMPEPKSDKEKFYLVGKGLQSQYYRVKNLEERLKKFTLIAPFQGTLIESFTIQGSLVSAGQKIGTFINSNLFELEVSVPAKYADKLVIGKEVSFLANDDISYLGKIIRVNNSIDDDSQSIRLFIEFESSELKDGMYSEVSIPLGYVEDSFSLSRSLLINDSYVYYVKSDMTVGIQSVQPIFYDDETVIVKGLENNMLILKNYIPGIYDGMKVKIVD